MRSCGHLASQWGIEPGVTMRCRYWLLLAVSVAPLLAETASADVTRLEALDVSPPGAPVRLWGRVEFSEAMADGKLRTTFRSGEITGRNESEKSIFTLVLRIERSTQRTSESWQPELDWFFSQQTFAPRMQQVLHSFEGTTTVLPYDGAVKPLSSQLTVAVVYAQFADGTEYGDRQYASELLAARKLTVEQLRALNTLLEEKSPSAFTEALDKEVEDQRIESVIESLRDEHKENGRRGVSRLLRGLLRLAEQRRSALES